MTHQTTDPRILDTSTDADGRRYDVYGSCVYDPADREALEDVYASDYEPRRSYVAWQTEGLYDSIEEQACEERWIREVLDAAK